MRKTTLICASLLLAAPALAQNVPPATYQAGDPVPAALVSDMGCATPGTWTWGAKVLVRKDGGTWTVLPTGLSNGQVINITGGTCVIDPAKLKIIR